MSDVAVVTKQPNDFPNQLYVGPDTATIYDMVHLGNTFALDEFTASACLALEDILQAHGYITIGPWADEIEYWQVPVRYIK